MPGTITRAALRLPLPVRPRILIAESRGFPQSAIQCLRPVADVRLADLNRSQLKTAVRSVDVLWVRLRHRIDAEILASAPRLKILATPTTGLTHIDVPAAEQRGIRVLSLRGETDFLKDVRATAELTVLLMLALCRRLVPASQDVLHHHWRRDLFQGRELFRRTIGIVGFGRLGRIVARYLRGFDAEVLASDPFVTAEEMLDHDTYPVSLQELLRRSDIVSLHVNLNAVTRNLIGKSEFALMQPHCCLVNTSRGEVVDEAALLEALQEGRLAGAALDVLREEHALSMPTHPLIRYARTHDNVLITPHVGGCTMESMNRTEHFLAQRLVTQFERQQLLAT